MRLELVVLSISLWSFRFLVVAVIAIGIVGLIALLLPLPSCRSVKMVSNVRKKKERKHTPKWDQVSPPSPAAANLLFVLPVRLSLSTLLLLSLLVIGSKYKVR